MLLSYLRLSDTAIKEPRRNNRAERIEHGAAIDDSANHASLHGAAIATVDPDPEGSVLERVRAIVGPDVPVVATLDDLDKTALVQILTRPKNAIIKQYQRLFEYENVRLKFSDEALEAIAQMAMERKVGARGLRMILEELMLDLMYYLPSQKKARDFVITKEMVLNQKISVALLEKAG